MIRRVFTAASVLSLMIAGSCPWLASQAEQSDARPALGATDAEVWRRVWPLFLVLPVIWIRVRLPKFVQARRTRSRTKLHQCVKCGYDVRATKERCPECGTPIPQ